MSSPAFDHNNLWRFLSTDNPPPKVVQGYKVHIDCFLFNIHSFCSSSTYFTPTLSTSRRRLRIKSSKSLATTRRFFYISAQVLLTKTLRSESSIVNGNFRINGKDPQFNHNDNDFDINNSGFRSSFDRGCLSLWFNFRRNVSVYLRLYH